MTQSRCVVLCSPRPLWWPPKRVPLLHHWGGGTRKYTPHFLLHACTNTNCYKRHTRRLCSSEYNVQVTVKRASGFRRCTVKRHWRCSGGKLLKNIYKNKKNYLFLSLNIPWCKRKILNVKTFLSDELWWSVPWNLRWMCVCPTTCSTLLIQLCFLFQRHSFHFNFTKFYYLKC